MAIDPQFIDVIPPSEMRTCLPRTDRLGASWPIYEDQVDTIPRSEWPALAAQQDRSLQPLVRKIKDQGQEGSCASNACSGAAEAITVKQFGIEAWIELSAMSLYKRVASSAQSGSTINDNIREISTRGILPTDTPQNKARFAHTHPNTGFGRSLPTDWEVTANRFRILEWFDVASMDGFVSAILRGAPVFYGRAGHAIFAVSVKTENGIWYLKYANSWGEWGEDGFGYDSESFVRGSIQSYGAVAPRVVSTWDDWLIPREMAA